VRAKFFVDRLVLPFPKKMQIEIAKRWQE